jgi:RNA polymerase sigma-70 factor (ECF subfamily)
MVATPDEAAAFRALHDANRQRVCGLLARLAGPREADDLTQVVFAKAAKALPGFRGEADASTWLYRIAVNVASDWLRSRARQEADATVPLPEGAGDAPPVLPGAADRPPSPEEELAHKDVNACIRGEIAKLSDAHRDVLMLSFLAGMNDDEIARTLDISVANAKVRLHRGRQEFRAIIAARCDFYSNELSCKPSSPDCCEPQDTGKPSR